MNTIIFKSKRLYYWLLGAIGIGLVIYLAIGNRQMALMDYSLRDDIPCPAPCWQNITPGVTNSSEALSTIQDSKYVISSSLKVNGTLEQGGALWKWKAPGARMDPGISWAESRIYEIRIPPTYGITIQEVLSKHGLPEKISVDLVGIPEAWEWAIDLFYSNQGLQFKVFVSGFSTDLEASSKISVAYLFSPTNVVARMVYLGLDEEDLQDWKGFGNISTLYYGK